MTRYLEGIPWQPQRLSPSEFLATAASPDFIQSFLSWHLPVHTLEGPSVDWMVHGQDFIKKNPLFSDRDANMVLNFSALLCDQFLALYLGKSNEFLFTSFLFESSVWSIAICVNKKNIFVKINDSVLNGKEREWGLSWSRGSSLVVPCVHGASSNCPVCTL